MASQHVDAPSAPPLELRADLCRFFNVEFINAATMEGTHTRDCPYSLLNVLRRELTEAHVQNLQLQDPMVRALLHSPVKRLSSQNELLSRELFLLNTMVRGHSLLPATFESPHRPTIAELLPMYFSFDIRSF